MRIEIPLTHKKEHPILYFKFLFWLPEICQSKLWPRRYFPEVKYKCTYGFLLLLTNCTQFWSASKLYVAEKGESDAKQRSIPDVKNGEKNGRMGEVSDGRPREKILDSRFYF